MKSIAVKVIVMLLVATAPAFSQSKSYETLRDKFRGHDDVHSFSVSGFFARTALWMAGEHEFTSAIKELHSIKLIVIPTEAFTKERVSVAGFKRIIARDQFEELSRIHDNGDDVTFYIQESKKKDNRYMIVVEEDHEVVVIEMHGFIDPQVLLENNHLTFNNENEIDQ